MTHEVRQSETYKSEVDKILGYSKGQTFSVRYSDLNGTNKKYVRIALCDCIRDNIIAYSNSKQNNKGEITEQEFIRL